MLLSMLMAWVGIVAERIRQQKRTLEPLDRYGPTAEYRHGYVIRLWFLSCLNSSLSPNPNNVVGATPKDADLLHLKGLVRLESLCLCSSNVSDTGLLHIKGMTTLKTLRLSDAAITDSGLEHLKGLKRLKYLDIRGTHVTKEGIEEFRKAIPNCEIQWDDPNN